MGTLPSQSTIVSVGFEGGTRGSPIMPRDVSLSDSKCWNGGQMNFSAANDEEVHSVPAHGGAAADQGFGGERECQGIHVH